MTLPTVSLVEFYLRTTIRVSSKDSTGAEDRGAPRVFPGVSLVQVHVPLPVMKVVEGPHVVGKGGLPLDEGVVGEPHAVSILALTPGLQTLIEF